MDILYIGIFLISIAFAIVVVYLSTVLNSLSKTMRSLGTSLGEFEKELEYITPQLTTTLRESERLIDDISEKVRATDSVFDSVENVGVSINSLNEVYKEKSKQLSEKELEQKLKPFIDALTWSEAAAQLFSKWTTTKPKEKKEVMVQRSEVVPVNTGNEG